MSNSETRTVEVTGQQRNLILNALYDKLLDNRRYMSGSGLPTDAPGPLDSCCAGHLARYERDKETYLSLLEQKKAINATILLFLPEGEDVE